MAPIITKGWFSVIATVLAPLALMILNCLIAPVSAKLGPISVESVYTTDDKFNNTKNFLPGDRIHYHVDVVNTTSAQMPINIRFQAFPNDYSPNPSLYRYDYKYYVDKMPVGLSRFYTPADIPFSAPVYFYAVRITITPGDCQGTGCENDGDWGESNFWMQSPTPMARQPQGNAPNLIVLVHGCCTDPTDLSEWDRLGNKIYAEIADKTQSEVVVWDWTPYTPKPLLIDQLKVDAWVYDAITAYGYASGDGDKLATQINNADARNRSANKPLYKYIHLIGHSAGAKLIDQVSRKLADRQKLVYLTFLDAFTPGNEANTYGSFLSNYSWHYAEHYVDRGGLPSTDSDLKFAFNFDITYWQQSASEDKGFLGHQWPRYWYEQTVRMPDYPFGHHLSLEGGDDLYQTNSAINRLIARWGSSQAACELESETSASCQFN